MTELLTEKLLCASLEKKMDTGNPRERQRGRGRGQTRGTRGRGGAGGRSRSQGHTGNSRVGESNDGNVRRREPPTTEAQFHLMLDYFANVEGMAQNRMKVADAHLAWTAQWDILTAQLNALEGPTKSRDLWIKVYKFESSISVNIFHEMNKFSK